MGLLGGNWADVNSMAFLTTYKNLGTLFIVLIIIVAMGIYLAKREKKHVFLLMAFMVAAVFTLGHEMHERYLVPAVGLLLFSAIIYRSRRLLVCAVELCIRDRWGCVRLCAETHFGQSFFQ